MKRMLSHMQTLYMMTTTRWKLLFACLVVCLPGIGFTQASKPVEISANTPWVIAKDEPEAVQRALDDVQTDWYKVFGHVPVVLSEPPKDWKGVVIYFGTKGPWMKDFNQSFPGPESFSLSLQEKNGSPSLVVTGADMRGAIYAAYALSEEILGVDPWYYWIDKEPLRQATIAVPAGYNKQFGTPTFKYRGWFINDEDLLNTFAADPMKENVFSLQMFDKIYETILRLRGNMVVPATFNFPDERCMELAARRGLVLNMHHIFVLGLNTYRWPKDVQFSYTKNPAMMERYWQTCIKAFKNYEVVWTVGYRGKHDRPFWRDEPEIATPEARGAVITKAIAKQVEMIRKVHPGAPIIANMWWEGADLFHEGHIKLPQGVTVVWPDAGEGIIRDQGRVQAGEGIYYHTAMLSGQHNQLSEMVNPARIYNQVGRFIKAGATEFFLVNVSDVRPVPLSTDCVMKLVWDAKPYAGKTDEQNMDAFLLDWCKRQFGSDLAPKMAPVYKQYYMIPYMRDDALKGENSIHTSIRNLHNLVDPLLASGKPLTDSAIQLARTYLQSTSASRAYVEDLKNKAEPVITQLPVDRVDFYLGHLLTQIQVHLQSLNELESYCKAVIDYQAGDRQAAIADAQRALQASNDLFAALKKAEYGKWAGWYMGEGFVQLNGSYDIARVLLARLRGEPIPPIRARHGYEDLYKYQEQFSKNFPLLYPGK